jgi:F0F1-type ATP synthase assembly protein I
MMSRSSKGVRRTVYIVGALLGSLVGYGFDHMLYANGGSALMKVGIVLGLCLAYVILGPAPKVAAEKEEET